MTSNKIKKGIIAAVTSNILFGVLYVYSDLMQPMSGSDVFAWRMLAMCGGLWTMLWLSGGRRDVWRFIATLQTAKAWGIMLLTTAILASQLWLFMWGPVNGEGVNVAIGYFLFPLTMIIGGRVFLRESVNRWQWLAIGLAVIGVAHEISVKQSFSWTTLWVCGTYPIYYLSRRAMGVPALVGLTFDLTLIMPVALLYLLYSDSGLAVLSDINRYWLLIPLLGLISAAAMQLNLDASRHLPVTLFGLFSYVEPMLLFGLAVIFLHAPLTADSLLTYGLIWCGIAVAMTDVIFRSRRPRAVIPHVDNLASVPSR